MISNYTQVYYYSPRPRAPSIIRPYSNAHWSSSRIVEFIWIYNSFDIQQSYQLQVFSYNSKESAIPDGWFEKITEDDDDVTSYVGSSVVNITETSVLQNKTIDFSSISPLDLEDGSYLWRIRTKGSIASSWSDWNPNGLVNLDAVSPILRNVCIETPSSYDNSNKPNMASYISDMSMPFISSERTVAGPATVEDRHIDRYNDGSLYIYYDYRDNSITLRAQKGGDAADPRFYGFISFHATENELTPDYSVQSAIKGAYLYRINKDSVDGPFEQIRYSEHESNKFIGNSLSDLIYTRDSGSTVNDFIPKGFPKFWQGGGVYGGTSIYENHPVGLDSALSFFSSFPFSTRIITRKLTFPIAGPTGSSTTQTFTDIVEMTYPAPYNDLFILFTSDMDNILAYGQYKTSDLRFLDTDITGSYNFVLKRGFDVRSWKNSTQTKPNPSSDVKYQFWTTISTSETDYQDNPNLRGPFNGFSPTQTPNGNIRSNYFFFNLTADDDYDNAIKIYLRPKALYYPETENSEKIDNNAPEQIPYIEFNFSPDSDCSFEATQPDIYLDNVAIGKGKISPKGLSYSERSPRDKKILTNVKNPPIPFVTDDDLISGSTLWTYVNKWGCDNDVLAFSGEEDSYNASFRLKIPLFRYVPYYHPGSVNYLEDPTNSQPPVPNIYDADPIKDANDVIGWDTITLETKENSSEAIEALPDSGLIYQGDYIQFMGTAKPMGQMNPFLYNFEKWGEDDVPQGTILRVRDYKAFQPYLLKPEEYFFFGQAMFEDGWFYDGTHFNDIDRGLYSIGSVDRDVTSTTSELNLINFSNYLFRKSLNIANETIFDNLDEFSDDIHAIDGQVGDDENTFLLESTLLNLSTGSLTNGQTWIYSVINDADFKEGLIRGDEISVQAHFGILGEFDSTWVEDVSNSYGGQYISLRDNDVDTDSQIERVINTGSVFHYITLSPVDRFDIPVVPASNKALRITGDPFSMGNIFGYVTPSSTGKVKIFFDAKEANAGIKEIKVFQVSLDDSSSNLKDCAQFIGPKDVSDNDTKIPILMQKINNKQFDFLVPSTVTAALTSISSSRSPISLYEYYFDNNITLWENAETATKSIQDWTSGEAVVEEIEYTSDEAGYFHEIAITGTGLKLIFIQIRDRSNNVSGLYPIPVYVPSGSTIQSAIPIESSTISVDDGQVIRQIDTATVDSVDYEFVKHLLPTDTDKSRSVVIKKLIIEDVDNEGEYIPVENVDELVSSFSDNYGLSFSTFAPLSSINTWRFTRPISTRVKSYTQNQRYTEPMWYFDPNHVRHYSSDTDADFAYYNANNSTQVNNSLTGVTLLGFSLKTGSFNDINPFANKLIQFKEEFIGKTLKLGNLPNQDFTILHIFEGTLSSITKPIGNNNQTRTIDRDDAVGVNKVWVVIEDPDGIAAIVASRKFQYITGTSANTIDAKKFTYKGFSSESGLGFGSTSSDNFTRDFGYTALESDIDTDVNDIINAALKMDGNVTSEITHIPGEGDPAAFNEGELSIYILPNSAISNTSGITTNEGWITQLFQAFVMEGNNLIENPSTSLLLSSLTNRQLIGLNVYNKFVFGQNHDIEAEILNTSEYVSALSGTLLVVDGDPFDETMVTLSYKIYDETNSEFITVPNQTIKKVAKTGNAVLVNGDITSYLDFTNTYKLIVTLGAVDSTDPTTGALLPSGFWPSLEGIVIPPLGSRLGTVSSSNTSARENVKFVIVSNGAFYIPENGDYLFEIQVDDSPNTYADFAVDFLSSETIITDIVEDGAGGFETKNVGGFFNTNLSSPEKTFYLTKGWHIGRFRYVATDSSNANHTKVLYSKASWNDTDLRIPMIGDNSGEYTFLARNYKSVHCKILDQNFDQKYPNPVPSDAVGKANQYARGILGFITELQDISSTTTSNQVALIKRNVSSDEVILDEGFGERTSFTLPEQSPTFAGQIFEEVYGIYYSNIFDGTTSLRNYKTISWNPDQSSQPDGTSVQFEIRTAATEAELLSKEFNVVEINGEDVKLDPFTISGSSIVRFSFIGAGDNPDDIIINRFLQFKMTLKSRTRDVTPYVESVTISYSSENATTFFTTTFSLSSRILRGILAANLDLPNTSDDVAETEIRFGICTEEVTDGIVSTNFDLYKTIYPNEAFSLSQIGMAENDKFRIGIRFISSSEKIPTCEEFAFMFESEGKSEQINKDSF